MSYILYITGYAQLSDSNLLDMYTYTISIYNITHYHHLHNLHPFHHKLHYILHTVSSSFSFTPHRHQYTHFNIYIHFYIYVHIYIFTYIHIIYSAYTHYTYDTSCRFLKCLYSFIPLSLFLTLTLST